MKALSLRSRFMLIVMVGAILPLALVGWWLTGTAIGSWHTVLRGQLSAAVDNIAADAQNQWTLRTGELTLLTNNSVVQAALGDSGARLTLPDSQYLSRLADSFKCSIASMRVIDRGGRVHWSIDSLAHAPQVGMARTFARPECEAAPDLSRLERDPFWSVTFPIDLPVQTEAGRVIGGLRARMRLGSVIGHEVSQRTVPGAVFGVVDGESVLYSSSPEQLNLLSPPTSPAWEVVTRVIEGTPLKLIIAGPAAPFVGPFESKARVGVAVLIVVTLVALSISALLTGRITESISRMALAAEGIAGGDLQRRVDATGDDEIGRLAGAFNAMSASLRETVAELSRQRSLAAVGEFAASLSHEVRNALTAMRIDLQHTIRQLPTDSNATPLVTRTLDTVRRLDSTVTGALRVARSGTTVMSRVDLVKVLQRAMASAEPSFGMSGANLEPMEWSSGPLFINGDASAIEQLFLNLLLNAAQALPKGSSARVAVDHEDKHIVVTISDSGVGFDAATVPDDIAFSRSTKPDGTGLGLPIARRIATAHGGHLRIESAVGNGTTVIVTLPRPPE